MSIASQLERGTGPSGRGDLYGHVLLGVVEDNADKQNKGLLQVKIPLLEGKKDVLIRVRVARPYASGRAGFYFQPEKGDLVLVAFTGRGRAYVIGSVFAEKSAYEQKCFHEKNYVKAFTTRGGTQILFTDEGGKEKITLTTPKKQSLVLDDENERITLQTKEGTRITLDAKAGAMTLEAKKQLTLQCGKSSLTLQSDGKTKLSATQIDVSATQSLQLAGKQKTSVSGQNITVKATLAAKISGSQGADLTSSGIVNVKGSMIKLNG